MKKPKFLMTFLQLPRKQRTVSIALAILALGLIAAVILVKTRPEAERRKPPRMTPVVECELLTKGTQEVVLNLLGTVMPAESIELKAQVSGEIVKVDDNWIEGGILKEGAAAVTLEATDYRIALRQAEADLAQAQSEFELEIGRQDVAKREWKLLGSDEGDRDLALRVPQLKAAQARVETARARKEAAELAVSRTGVKVPFNALVVERRMNRGDIASSQASLGTIVSTDVYHVKVSLPVRVCSLRCRTR
jgi:multidrug resistance efflux pump